MGCRCGFRTLRSTRMKMRSSRMKIRSSGFLVYRKTSPTESAALLPLLVLLFFLFVFLCILYFRSLCIAPPVPFTNPNNVYNYTFLFLSHPLLSFPFFPLVLFCHVLCPFLPSCPPIEAPSTQKKSGDSKKIEQSLRPSQKIKRNSYSSSVHGIPTTRAPARPIFDA